MIFLLSTFGKQSESQKAKWFEKQKGAINFIISKNDAKKMKTFYKVVVYKDGIENKIIANYDPSFMKEMVTSLKNPGGKSSVDHALSLLSQFLSDFVGKKVIVLFVDESIQPNEKEKISQHFNKKNLSIIIVLMGKEISDYGIEGNLGNNGKVVIVKDNTENVDITKPLNELLNGGINNLLLSYILYKWFIDVFSIK